MVATVNLVSIVRCLSTNIPWQTVRPIPALTAAIVLLQSIEDRPKPVRTIRGCRTRLRYAQRQCEPDANQRGANCNERDPQSSHAREVLKSALYASSVSTFSITQSRPRFLN
jgi:hypothetical protein